jgi:exonuclease III
MINNCFGTGFIVSKRLRTRVIDFKPMDMKICVSRIKGRFQNYSIICTHAPTEDKSEMEKDQFYEQLERTNTQCHSYDDIKIIIGDFNAKVENESWARTAAGGHSLHDESNGNAVHQRIMIDGTLLPHKSIHKGT